MLRLGHATWLSDSFLLVQFRGRPYSGPLKARVTFGEHVLDLEAHSFAYRHYGRLRRRARQLIVVRFPPEVKVPWEPALHFELGGKELSLPARELGSALTHVSTVLREELVGLSRAEREAVHGFILSHAVPCLEEPGGFSLSKRLRAVREALREPLPEALVRQEEGQVVLIESLMALDDRAFWISGWSRDEDGTFTDLAAVSPEGQRVQLDDAFRAARTDVEQVWRGSGVRRNQKHGFVQYFELPAPSPLEKGWIVELRDRRGAGVEANGPNVLRDIIEIRDRLFEEFSIERPCREEFRVKHLHPALSRLQKRARESVGIESVVEYGTGNPTPTVSVIVGLYQRLDLLSHQLLSFAQDPAMQNADLIYVLDSPELAGPLSDLASTLYALHRIPFRIVTLTRSAGFPNANNLGASVARGRLLLLLNSDVFPERPGWLEQMAGFYQTTPGIGALGPKLLYEDDSIQHAGMYFERDAAASVWRNQHYFKGLHRSFPPASATRPVPAVTGACLMIDRELYQGLGGFRDTYIRGGYEDSDLCLRLIEKGLQNWYLSEIELHHLEAQSFTAEARRPADRYNTWLQTHWWGKAIEELMRQHPQMPLVSEKTRLDLLSPEEGPVQAPEPPAAVDASAPPAS